MAVQWPPEEANGTAALRTTPDPLLNPLRSVLITFACVPCGCFDVYGTTDAGGIFRCRRCLSGEGPKPKRCAYTTLLYGKKAEYVLGALALGQSLVATGTQHDRVLLHTGDVPKEAHRLLQEYWRLQEVAYILSAPDLHTVPYEEARFKEVFTKLQVLNPAALPYDRVVFLDLDTLVLRNIDDLFELRPPAAMCNMKTRAGRMRSPPEHGGRMDPHWCYFNAGAMVLAPSAALFELLAADVQEPDPQWHRGAWSPEQSYLAAVLAGEWSHISQLYNLEVQLHSGVPLSRIWEEAEASDVAVAHFSGHTKVWDAAPDRAVPVLGSDWVKQAYARMTVRTRSAVAVRCQALHAEWHRTLAEALRTCRERGLASEVGPSWAEMLHRGGTPAAAAAAVANLSTPVAWAGPLVGEDVVLSEEDGTRRLAKVVGRRCGAPTTNGAADGTKLIVWHSPSPSGEAPFCAGPFGLCFAVRAEAAVASAAAVGAGAETEALGAEVVAWLGEGHARGLVVACRGASQLVRFATKEPPHWLPAERLHGWGKGQGPGEPPAVAALQCAHCLERAAGSFGGSGLWRCGGCAPLVAAAA